MATNQSLNQTIKIKGMRYYEISKDYLLPSVTTILGKFSDKSGLDAWRKRVGRVEADRDSKFSANRGTVMHQMCEYYMLAEGSPWQKLKAAQIQIIPFCEAEGFTESEYVLGRRLFYNFYNTQSFNRIKKIVSVEETLYSTKMGGYAGRVDAIFLDNNDKLIILDFKSSKKPKRDDWITGYKQQISAYYIAYWEMTGKQPAGGEIWISNEIDSSPQIFKLDVEDIKKHGKEFLVMVDKFHKYVMHN
tara:strand:+ start:12262 stop:12999 length:738 start_codon:yes stop_codon:yes gene_type:complete